MKYGTPALRTRDSFGPVNNGKANSQTANPPKTNAMKKAIILLITFITSQVNLGAQSVLSGRITDANSGEPLIGATVHCPELQLGVTTDFNGAYSLELPDGAIQLEISYIGYQTQKISLRIAGTQELNFELKASATELTEVMVTDRRLNANVEDMKMSSQVLSVKQLKEIPAFMGETDVLKVIQALPGVQSGGEGTTGFFVRGGAADQNLVLLDGATVYSPSHLMGFFSVFNADVLKSAEIFKGGIPAQYGGRSASLLDIRLRDGDYNKFHANGGLGLIASRLSLEGPIQKGRSSFIIAGRRTYADVFTRLSSKEDVRNSTLYFYDLNGRVNVKLGEKDRISLSGYYGNDVLKNKEQLSWNWGNRTSTLNWKHMFSEKLAADVAAVYSDFSYTLGSYSGTSNIDWTARITDRALKADFSYLQSSRYSFRFGASSIHHTINPGLVKVTSEDINTSLKLETQRALESAVYASSRISVNQKLTIEAGLRYSLFQNIGGTNDVYETGKEEPVSSTTFEKGEFHDAQHGFEPRFNLRYLLGDEQSLKMSYNRMYQYLQQASNSTTGTPLDIYFPASNLIKPQLADQVALGYFQNLAANRYELSAEVYYKYMQNQIDFRDNANLILNEHLEQEILTGTGEAYGLELMLKKTSGKLTGWVSYTLSRTERTIVGINNDEPYRPRQDRPHAINLVASYQLKPRLQLGAAWTYASGSPISIPSSSYEHDGIVVPVYAERNGYRLPASHRMDLSLTLDNKKKPGRRWESSWNFSLYNAYGRQNPFTIQVRQNAENPKNTEAVQMSLIGTIVPAVTFNFKF